VTRGHGQDHRTTTWTVQPVPLFLFRSYLKLFENYKDWLLPIPLFLFRKYAKVFEKYKDQLLPIPVPLFRRYPKVFEEYKDRLEKYGDVSMLPTRAFIEPLDLGEEIEVELELGKTLG